MTSKLLCLSGIYAETGDYLLPPLTLDQAAEIGRQTPPPAVRTIEDFRIWLDEVLRGRGAAVRGNPDVDLSDLSQVGWGLIFAQEESPETVEQATRALADLIDLRKEQAQPHFKICQGDLGYQKGDTREKFLGRHGAPPNGRADPEKLPYYLLIIADPETIPYEFQYKLDVQYAVGRLWFGENFDNYTRYARSVVAAETASVQRRRRAVFFAPSHPNDPPTLLSATQLTQPLAGWSKQFHGSHWDVECFLGTDASRERLGRLLGGDETPAFLFTAGHGVVYNIGDERQRDGQGALVCQEWPGPKNPVMPEYCFGAQDLDNNRRVEGLVSFHFACDSAGTSRIASFRPRERLEAAEKSFIASLPQKLLSHPNGSALAVIGHVGSAWYHSIEWPGAGMHVEAFEEVTTALLKGKRIGAALEAFAMRYADQAISLSDLLQEEQDWEVRQKDEDIIRFWTGAHDTRNFIVLGDPAARLAPAPSSR